MVGKKMESKPSQGNTPLVHLALNMLWRLRLRKIVPVQLFRYYIDMMKELAV
jgi:hypothetical protein